jgi:hypothetical protein
MGDSAIPFSPLLKAISSGDYKAAAKLLQNGADPNQIDPFYRPILYAAILAADPGMVHLLLRFGADANAPFKGITPLLAVASNMNSLNGRYENNVAIAFLLLQYGADFNAKNTKGRRAVNRAPDGILKDFLMFVDERRAVRSQAPQVAPQQQEQERNLNSDNEPPEFFAASPPPSPSPVYERSPSPSKRKSQKKTAKRQVSTKRQTATKSKKAARSQKTAKSTKIPKRRSATQRKQSRRSPNTFTEDSPSPNRFPFAYRKANNTNGVPYVPKHNPATNKTFSVRVPQGTRKHVKAPQANRE